MSHNHEEVAHHWANKTGKCWRGYNVYYKDDIIYSHGPHFPIAKHVDGDIVLMTTKGYSSSTAKHIAVVRYATNHLTIFNVANVLASTYQEHKANVKGMLGDRDETIRRALGRRMVRYADQDLSRAGNQTDNAEAYRLKYCKRMSSVAKMPELTIFKAGLEAQRELHREQKQIRAQELQERQDKLTATFMGIDLPAWRAGQTHSLPRTGLGGSKYLRLIRDAEGKPRNIQTSGRVMFPAEDFAKGWPILCGLREIMTAHGHDKITDLALSEIKFGDFKIDEITSEGVKAACHFVPWSEGEYIAEELSLDVPVLEVV